MMKKRVLPIYLVTLFLLGCPDYTKDHSVQIGGGITITYLTESQSDAIASGLRAELTSNQFENCQLQTTDFGAVDHDSMAKIRQIGFYYSPDNSVVAGYFGKNPNRIRFMVDFKSCTAYPDNFEADRGRSRMQTSLAQLTVGVGSKELYLH